MTEAQLARQESIENEERMIKSLLGKKEVSELETLRAELEHQKTVATMYAVEMSRQANNCLALAASELALREALKRWNLSDHIWDLAKKRADSDTLYGWQIGDYRAVKQALSAAPSELAQAIGELLHQLDEDFGEPKREGSLSDARRRVNALLGRE
jgi:hypothetical protein